MTVIKKWKIAINEDNERVRKRLRERRGEFRTPEWVGERVSANCGGEEKEERKENRRKSDGNAKDKEIHVREWEV